MSSNETSDKDSYLGNDFGNFVGFGVEMCVFDNTQLLTCKIN